MPLEIGATSIETNIGKTKKVKKQRKKVKKEECIFPFKFKGGEYNDCLDTGNGPWCPIDTLGTRGGVKNWAYCEDI